MLNVQYTTARAKPVNRKSYWEQVVNQTYFSLDVAFKGQCNFNGDLQVWDLGSVSLSLLESDALQYKRNKQHLLSERDENYLITIPEVSTLDFQQNNRQVACKPGDFILQRSHLPYQFSYNNSNRMLVIKVPAQTLRARVSMPERLVSLAFDASQGDRKSVV